VAIGRDIGDTGLRDVPGALAGDIRALKTDRAGDRLAQADERFHQLILAVAGDAGDTEDLAAPDLQVDAVDDLASPIVLDDQAGDLQGDIARVRFAAIDHERNLTADHQLGQVLFVGLRRDALTHDLAAADDRDPVGDLQDFVELVADEHDAVPGGRQPAQDSEDLLGLLGREDGRRLVQDQDLGIAIERLEDLHALLPADRQGAHLGIGIDLEAEAMAELDDALGCFLAIQEERVGHRLLAEDDVLGDGQHGHEHEVLVDHADATGDRIRGTTQGDGLPVHQDLALVGLGQPVQDVHEGRLAGTVLTQQGVDLARPDLQVDAVVGDDARIALRDPAHLEGRCLHRFDVAGHPRRSLMVSGYSERAGHDGRPARRFQCLPGVSHPGLRGRPASRRCRQGR
jgi:hypothetical protein